MASVHEKKRLVICEICDYRANDEVRKKNFDVKNISLFVTNR